MSSHKKPKTYGNKLQPTEEQFRLLKMSIAQDQELGEAADYEPELTAERDRVRNRKGVKPEHVAVRTRDEERVMYKDGSEEKKIADSKAVAVNKGTEKVKELHTKDPWDNRTTEQIPDMMKAELKVDEDSNIGFISLIKGKTGTKGGMGSMDLRKAHAADKEAHSSKGLVKRIIARQEAGGIMDKRESRGNKTGFDGGRGGSIL